MKKILYLLLVAAALTPLFIACNDDENSALSPTESIGNPVTAISVTNAGSEGITLPDAGATLALQIAATPTNADNAGNYVFTSGDRKIFTVSADGVLTATGAGTAMLTIISKNDASVKAQYKVTVVGVRITSIEIADDYKTRTLDRTNAAGPSFNLKQNLTVEPANASVKELKYTSSAPEVATVDENGEVTAVWEGTAVIRAEATDGSGKFAESTITVTITPIATITIGANIQNLVLNTFTNLIGTADNGLVATIPKSSFLYTNYITYSPGNATRNTLVYTSSDETVVTVEPNANNYPMLTPKKGGTATISVTAADGKGATASFTVLVYEDIKRNGWRIVDNSPDGAVMDGETSYGGSVSNLISDDDVAAGLLKSATYNVSALRDPAVTDSYFTIDLGAETEFGYMIITDTYCGGINSYVKINYISLYGSNDGTNFTLLQGDITKSTSTYNVPIKLNDSHTYRYVKAIVWHNSTNILYTLRSHYVIKDFRLAKSPQ